jgi:sulfur-carrier protein adenylyltransferase/sulfurtransferase
VDGTTLIRGEAGGSAGAAGDFRYEEAFSRNLGWLTEWEQQALRGKRVAIAGMGGVGGWHLLTLVRFGIGAFHIADLDRFELVNFNRQAGAALSSLGRPKIEVMAEMARQINPELVVTCFNQGVTEANLDAFLAGVDLCVDGLDLFALDIRRKLNARCRSLDIPVVNAAPLGMGTGFLIFVPSGTSFEEWFDLDGLSDEQQLVSYLLGMSPHLLHRDYLVDSSQVDLRNHRGPSTVAGCELCAAVASVEAIKVLLRRGPMRAVPYYHHFDAYRGRWIVRKLRGGNRNPVQRLKIALARRFTAKVSQMAAAPQPAMWPHSEIEKILDIARWAPSGDNQQPWRFEIVDQDRVVICLTHKTDDLYDYRDGEPTLLSGGMLLESMRLGASRWNRSLEWTYAGCHEHVHRINVLFPRASETAINPLVSYIPIRSVDRRSYRLRALTDAEKSALAEALGSELEIEWHEGWRQRWRLARLGARATAIRLSIPEAFAVHRRIIDWDRQHSPDRIPAAAAGLSRASLGPMRWAMQSWPRMRLLNAMGGLLSAQVQMDYVPGMRSAAFFAIRMRSPVSEEELRPAHLLQAGMAIQRFWLTATALNLAVQPGFATLIFAEYGDRPPAGFTDRRTQQLSARLTPLLGEDRKGLIFLGRIGVPLQGYKSSRSTRLPLTDLIAAGHCTQRQASQAKRIPL